MRKFSYTFLTLISVLFLSSCIQSEEPNSEADIISCEILENTNEQGETNQVLKTSPIINNNSKDNFTIRLIVKDRVEDSSLTPIFTTTEGATTYILNTDGKYDLYPSEGETLDFSTNKKIKVISQDKKWEKIYTMSIVRSEIPTMLSFEDVVVQKAGLTNQYYEFIEYNEKKDIVMTWASGNPGYSMTGSRKKPDDFPTIQSPDGYIGKCLKLVTRSTGGFGEMVNKPIAAGNLFVGEFVTEEALGNALKATKFGLPFSQVPSKLIGYYKYKKGPKFSELGKENPNKEDIGDVYAVFYETDKNFSSLDGTNQFTDDHIYSIARMGVNSPAMIETEEWIKFEIPFVERPNKYLNLQKLEEGEYKLAIVFSSSKEGDLFNGAVNSTLYIDEVELILKDYPIK